ncbi:MAG: hypothetical protein COA99_04400 [Moraxellaceae bacterium]|nr:MAG: hypothetical protein COA99_04400 [Moraxellaceae bacterium]
MRYSKLLLLLLISIQFPTFAYAFESSTLVRETNYGWVQGTEYIDYFDGNKTESLAWIEIPYAQPPIGNLRWNAPRPPIPWDNLRLATKFGSYEKTRDSDEHACVQYAGMLSTADTSKYGTKDKKPQLLGSEDCLYLNIWRPKTTVENTLEKKLAVYVWIHGGANSTGKSGSPIYRGGNFSAKTNVIFISINYRLGAFGFFTNPALRENKTGIDASGNYGILDIIQALKWIKGNISHFGGDPNNITIAGESSGGLNIYGLLVSDLATGLFHKAIIQSGGPLTNAQQDLDKKTDQLIMDLKVAEQSNQNRSRLSIWWEIKHESPENIIQYLRSKSADEILSKFNSDLTQSTSQMGMFYIDGVVLKNKPTYLLKQGEYNQVPIITGNTRDEIKFFPTPLLIDSEKSYVDKLLNFTPETPNYKLSDFLIPGTLPVWNAMGLASGYGFQYVGVDNPLTIIENNNSQPFDNYAYRFDWDEAPEPMDKFTGAGHMLDIPFALGNFHTNCNTSEANCYERKGNCVDPLDNCDVNSAEWVDGNRDIMSYLWSEANRTKRIALSEKMMSYWSNFAKTGNPNGKDINHNPLPPWPTWSQDHQRMILDSDI